MDWSKIVNTVSNLLAISGWILRLLGVILVLFVVAEFFFTRQAHDSVNHGPGGSQKVFKVPGPIYGEPVPGKP